MALSFAPKEDDKSSRKNDDTRSESNKIKIITDNPITDAPDFNKYSRTLSDIIVNSLPRFAVGIYGGWGTGKTTLMEMIQNQLKEKYKNEVIPIWFDAWRYENEELSALVPLVRTIILHLEDYVKELEFEKNPKKGDLKNLAKKFKKMGEAILENSKANAEAGSSGAKASIETDIGKAMDHYKSGGFFFRTKADQSRVYFHKHISDRVKAELERIRKKEATENLKIVIFVDDLDRCTPERALEILESIKTFFDIKGIIFVIGIDPSTIDPIIRTKYGKDSKIDGMKYLQKIVQLPYPMPLWNPPRLSDTITSMIKETNLPKNVIDKVLEPDIQDLIIKATELNPRDVKRFVNSIVISHELYGHHVDDIEKIVAIQAFYFHGDKWIEFLKLLIPYEQRVVFLMHFIMWLEKEPEDISNLYDLKNILLENKALEKDDYLYKSLANKSLLEIYKRLVELDDKELFTFLTVSKKTLLKVDKIEKYLEVSDPFGMAKRTEKFLDIDSGKQLNLLRNRGVTEFNEYRKRVLHLPFVELTGSDLRDFRLSRSLLFRANLNRANLAGANLAGANLSGANLNGANLSEARLYGATLVGADLIGAELPRADLSEAHLSEADLSTANLSEADLTIANLSGANLYGATLVGADLSEADLSKANFVEANLSKADLSKANLVGADLSRADLSGAIFVEADLSKADLSEANLFEANLPKAKLTMALMINVKLSDAILDAQTDFSDAIIDDSDSLKYLHEKQSQNIPNEIKNKRELREKLMKSVTPDAIDYYLSSSKLAET
jgi:uncharacterized protein YjbI with pentapeptide repeats